MSISQIVAIGIVGAVLSMTLRQMSPEIALFVGIATGILIFFTVIGRLEAVIGVLSDMTNRASLSMEYIKVIMKVIGIAYIAEFGMQLCKDAGESVIASRIELAGKVLIMTVSVPVIIGVMETITLLLP